MYDAAARGEIVARRRRALNEIKQFYNVGEPLFARYMRFSRRLSPVAWVKAAFDYLHSVARGAIVRH
jgi:hypothetical protein